MFGSAVYSNRWVLLGAFAALTACGGGGGDGGGGGRSNTAPVITSQPSATIYSGNVSAFTVTASDAQNDQLAYSLLGEDSSLFRVSTSGVITFISAPDYDSPADKDRDNEYLISVNVSDGKLSTTMDLALQVTKPSASAYSWQNAPWAGAYVSGLVYHPKEEGLLYARTLTGGAYRWNEDTKKWTSITDTAPLNDFECLSVQSIALDAADPDRIYLAVGQGLFKNGAILRSVNRGRTWTRIDLPFSVNGHDNFASTGERLVVDPNKGSVLLYGLYSYNRAGIYKSIDYGATWKEVRSTILPTFLAIDPKSAQGTNGSQVMYAGTHSGLLKSADGGESWTHAPYSFGLQTTINGVFDNKHNLYLALSDRADSVGSTSGSVQKLNTQTGVWEDITPLGERSNGGYRSVSISESDPNTLMATKLNFSGSYIYRSTDGGENWALLNSRSEYDISRSVWLNDTPIGNTRPGYHANDVEIDPFNSDRAFYNSSAGVFVSENVSSDRVKWRFESDGLDVYSVSAQISPRKGTHYIAANTQGVVRYNDILSGNHSESGTFLFSSARSLDFAELNPNIIVRSDVGSGMAMGAISRDNGISWQALLYRNPNDFSSGRTYHGPITVSAKGGAVFWLLQDGEAIFSTNSGVDWKRSNGFDGSGVYTSPVADRAVDNIFYVLDVNSGALLESHDGGAQFTSTPLGVSLTPDAQLLAVPWKRRNLWLATEGGLFHVDGVGGVPVKIQGVTAAYRIGYGAPAPGRSAHSLYLYGKVNSVIGLYRSDDQGENWIRINDEAHSFGPVNVLTGDPRVWGRVYVGTKWRGTVVGNRF